MTDAVTNRADPRVTTRVDLPCRCPGTPHQGDSAEVVRLFGYGARGQIRQAARIYGREAGELTIILLGVQSWTFTMPDGTPRPVTEDEVALLDEATVKDLLTGLDGALAVDPVPKARGARSRGGSRASSSSTPTPMRRPKSTTG